jgi:hypothetical protein
MGHDHIVPPSVFDIAFEEYAERTVVPKTVESAVDFGRLEQKASAFAQGNEIFHLHGERNDNVKMIAVILP